MRGLDVRVLLARARIMELIDADEAQDMYYEVMNGAMCEGMQDALNGISRPPILFRDEKLLISGWHDGFVYKLESMEMEECWECHNGTGNPCSVHG
jgi:hypothetical protein